MLSTSDFTSAPTTKDIRNNLLTSGETEQMRSFNTCISSIPEDRLTNFVHKVYSVLITEMQSLKAPCTTKTQTQFARTEFNILSSVQMNELLSQMMNIPNEMLSECCHLVKVGIVTEIRKHILNEMSAENIPGQSQSSSSDNSAKISELDKHGVASGKVRYVGGFVVAKSMFKTKMTIANQLNKYTTTSNKTLKMAEAKLKLLEQSAGSLTDQSSSIYPNTWHELNHRQRGKLVPLTDKAYHFFNELEKSRLQTL